MYANRLRLDGRAAFVTGGAQGIGWACADALAEFGAVVTIADRDPDLLARGVESLQDKGHRVTGIVLDVTDSAAVTAAADAVRDTEILVNNAGIARSETAAEDVADEHWLNVLDVNLNGTFWCARTAGFTQSTGGSCRRRSGSIVRGLSARNAAGHISAGSSISATDAGGMPISSAGGRTGEGVFR
jgi:NAD(P)-dependent dehydrogenase (short-subunit alcohol dehydrogenase family)